MADYIRVSAKTVEDAVTEASINLGTSRDNIEYRVIEHETKGFLGIGAKKAVIEAKVKKTEEDIINEVMNGTASKPAEKAPEAKAPAAKPAEKKPEVKTPAVKPAEKKPEAKAPAAKPAEKSQNAKAPAAKPAKPAKQAEKTPAAKPAKEETRTPRVPADPAEAKRRAEAFLTDMFKAMDLEVKIEQTFEDDTLTIDLAGEDMGVLIGKRGQTLDSIQYLVSLVVNKGKAAYVRVKVDTEDYRERRKATLENLAKNIAFKVKKTRKPVYLEPMNPYERRIIHSALQDDPYVTTHSEGEEPCRKVVVTLKKREFRDRDAQ